MYPINFLDPYMTITINKPKSKDEMKTMLLALKMYAEEDSSFFVYTNDICKQIIIAGKGEQHLNDIVNRLRNEFKIEIDAEKPQALYKETFTKKVKSEGRFIRQSGCPAKYGHCWIDFEPSSRNTGYEFINKVDDENTIPKEYIQSIDEGIQYAMTGGILGNYPVVDIKATLLDGSYHEYDSSQMSFKSAALISFIEGMKQADPVILEPIMKVNMEVPECNIPLMKDEIHSMRGKNVEVKFINGKWILTADVPLCELIDDTKTFNQNNKKTQGFSINFGYYSEIPESSKDTLITESNFRDTNYIDLFFGRIWGKESEERYLTNFVESFWK